MKYIIFYYYWMLSYFTSSFKNIRQVIPTKYILSKSAESFQIPTSLHQLQARSKSTLSLESSDAMVIQKAKVISSKSKSKLDKSIQTNIINSTTITATKFQASELSFVVNMEPRPLMRHMSRGGFMYNPSAPLQKKFLADCHSFLPSTPFDGPLELELYFYFKRPLSHYRTGQYKHILKETSPLYHTGRRDIDNLIKFVLDALNKVAYSDDSQVCILKSGKFYTSEEPRIEVVIRSLDPDHR